MIVEQDLSWTGLLILVKSFSIDLANKQIGGLQYQLIEKANKEFDHLVK